jgi:zinc transport system substrate-binding protein
MRATGRGFIFKQASRLLAATFPLVCAACGGAVTDDSETSGSVPPGGVSPPVAFTVYAVNYPLQYFAERIGGAALQVTFPAPPGDPAFWQPTADDIVAFQRADLILRNGADYARWVATATLPASRSVDTAAGFSDRLITRKDGVTHGHGPAGDHTHGGTAFTTWLDPTLAMQHARAIHGALTERLPEAAAALDAGLAALEADLQALDERLSAITVGHGATPLLASHPVYQYLARRYGLDLESVHLEPEGALSEQDWRRLEERLEARKVRAMLWEAEPLADTRSRLERSGIEVVVYDPCASAPATGDWLTRMLTNAESLSAGLEQSDLRAARQ